MCLFTLTCLGHLAPNAMSTLFISHASRDRDETLAVCAWLESQGWKDVFLDIVRDVSGQSVAGSLW